MCSYVLSSLLWSISWPRPTEVTCLLQRRCLKSPRRCLRRTINETDLIVYIPCDLEAGDPWDEGEPDAALCQSAEHGAGHPDPPSVVEDQVLLEAFAIVQSCGCRDE